MRIASVGGASVISSERINAKMDSFRDVAGAYAMDLHAAAVRVRLGWMVALGWVAFPFMLQTLLHPGDAIRLQYIVQGETPPHFLTAQQLGAGLVETVATLAVLLLVQMVCTVLFYRAARIARHGEPIATPTLWPLAALLPGVIGNAAWFVGTGYFDTSGFLIGLTPVVLTVAAEMVINQLGRDFVFGPAVAGLH
jgi:hypothetical protein